MMNTILSTRDFLPTVALWRATREQDMHGVVTALSKGADVNVRDENGDTALHTAVYSRKRDILGVLANHPGANINKRDGFGRTPLYVAVNIRAKEVSILHETVKYLLEIGANPNKRDIFSKTPLHVASFTGHLDIAKLLILNEADVNARDHSGEQPLTVAFLTAPNPSMARLLLRYGADLNTSDLVGQGLLSQAIYNCCSQNCRDSVAFLLRRGADVNFCEEVSFWTPLHAAALVNDAKLVQMMMDAGANLLAEDASGMCPLDIAVLAENKTAARELKKHYPPDADATAQRFHSAEYVSPNLMYL